jgi:acetyltransferase-like isoleucine patch superfamily enzyme
MNHTLNEAKWKLFRRIYLRFRVTGFSASIRSYVDDLTTFGKNSRVHGNAVILNSKLGNFTYATSCKIFNASVGNFCSIAAESMIGGLAPHPIDRISTSPAFYSTDGQLGKSFTETCAFNDRLENIIISDNVWIGFRAIILPGITIGEGAIVAAGALVTKNVAPYSIVAGVPARHIRYRCDEALIKRIIRMNIFGNNDSYFKQNIAIFQSNIGEFTRDLLADDLKIESDKHQKL